MTPQKLCFGVALEKYAVRLKRLFYLFLAYQVFSVPVLFTEDVMGGDTSLSRGHVHQNSQGIERFAQLIIEGDRLRADELHQSDI